MPRYQAKENRDEQPPDCHILKAVFYFFKREGATVTCEMRPSARGTGFDIILMQPGQPVVIEHFTTSDAVHKRWQQLQERFKGEGWWGPAGTHD